MLPEDKATILARIQVAKGNIRAVINMMETGNNCEIALLQLQSIQADLYTARRLLLLHQLQESIENICHNNCPEERSTEIEYLVDLYRYFLIYA
jgi:DNA-binding FrmR family transcriptional regulator